jgi:hypothetical protein
VAALQFHAVPAVGPAARGHAEPPAHGQGGLVVRADHREHLGQALGESLRDSPSGGLGGEAAAPAVGVEVPAHLDLAVSARDRDQQHRAGHDAGVLPFHGPETEPGVVRVGAEPLDPGVGGLKAVEDRGVLPSHRATSHRE